MKKYVYFFGAGKAEGKTAMKKLLGGKGANLAEMTNIGIPVPAGFTISTEACIHYYDNDENHPEGLDEQIEINMKKLEEVSGKQFGNSEKPLLVSVRSGAVISMPGMMDTVLNLGLNKETLKGLAKETENERFANDSYRRFIQMFGNVVLGIDSSEFEKLIEQKKEALNIELDTEINADELMKLCDDFKALIKEKTDLDFPEDPKKQLEMSINAVFDSWNNKRAITYRNLNNIPHDLGTGVNVQMMVFGNMGTNSGTGVAFTRNPSTGENKFYGEYLLNAQGEDVVAGIRTPHPITDLEKQMPEMYNQLESVRDKLEKHYKDMQDLEFTIENKELFLLQTRTGKRTSIAAVNIAVDMVSEQLIDKKTAITRVSPEQVDNLLHPMIDPNEDIEIAAKGLPASPGAAVGKVVFNSDEAEKKGKDKEKVVLVRLETSPEDIGGMASAQGILTARGGMTSHAAVVGRGMGKPCIVGCSEISIDEDKEEFSIKGKIVRKGDYITLNGNTGDVILGQTKLVQPKLTGNFEKLIEWADDVRTLGVRANADTPGDSEVALKFGAEGIGLCRTEHMFFAEDRLPVVRQMILADDKESRQKALDKLMPMQESDFRGIFEVMKGLPVTVRLLDPPLHEFLPSTDEGIEKAADSLGIELGKLKNKVESLREFNPMLGHRGCRLGITFPEIYKMQVRAIFEAACELISKNIDVRPEVMIPLVGHVNELRKTKAELIAVAEKIIKKKNVDLDYKVGTMIEIPRACLTADKIAEEADFFSFGTNDLTQMTFGFSRDDIAKFLPFYLEENILDKDPFMAIDQEGVGALMKIAVTAGRKVKPDLKIGICGEHGGEPTSVDFCYKIGLDYVSCSPYRVPVARLSAAQSAINSEKEESFSEKKVNV